MDELRFGLFPWSLIPWATAQVGDDDVTITVTFHATFLDQEIVPEPVVEMNPTEVIIGIRAVSPESGFGVWTSNGPEHVLTVALSEPVAGRRILDAWRPPAPPPPVLAQVDVEATMGVIAGRTLFIDSVDIYEESMRVNYRQRPGETDDDQDEPAHLTWDLEVVDDVGTAFDVPSGAYGGDEEEIRGDRDVRPAAPFHASTLTLIVYEVIGDGDYVERGRATARLPAPER